MGEMEHGGATGQGYHHQCTAFWKEFMIVGIWYAYGVTPFFDTMTPPPFQHPGTISEYDGCQTRHTSPQFCVRTTLAHILPYSFTLGRASLFQFQCIERFYERACTGEISYHRFLSPKSSLPQHRPPFKRAHDPQTTSQKDQREGERAPRRMKRLIQELVLKTSFLPKPLMPG